MSTHVDSWIRKPPYEEVLQSKTGEMCIILVRAEVSAQATRSGSRNGEVRCGSVPQIPSWQALRQRPWYCEVPPEIGEVW